MKRMCTVLLTGLLISCLCIGCSNTNNATNDTTSKQTEEKKSEEQTNDKNKDLTTSAKIEKGYKVIDLRIVDNGTGSYDAEGIIQNVSGDIVDYAEVFVTFYDEEGNSLGSFWSNTVNLMPNDTWKFVVNAANTESAVECKITKVNGF